MSRAINPLYFFRWDFIYFQQKQPIKYKFGEISHGHSQKSEILYFDGFLLSKSYKVSANQVQKSYLSWHWRVMQSLNKNWVVVSNITWGIWWIFTQPLRSLKILFRKYTRFDLQKYGGVVFYDTELWRKIWINPQLAVSKMPWGIWWTFIRALKSLKNCTVMGFFCPKHIMFQLENLIGIMYHDTEELCNI